MNAKMREAGMITLPADVVEALGLKPGNEVSFRPGANGEFTLSKAAEAPVASRAEIRKRLERGVGFPRGLDEFAGMTTDEFMEFLRGE